VTDIPSPEPEGREHWQFSRSDLALLRRAARENWGTPDCMRTEALFQLAKIVAGQAYDLDTRHRIAAIKTLVAFDRNDLVAAKLALDAEKLELARLKIAPPKETQARDAWSELLRDIEREESARAPEGQAGGVSGADPGAQAVEQTESGQ
jgi:hypothetical protein